MRARFRSSHVYQSAQPSSRASTPSRSKRSGSSRAGVRSTLRRPGSASAGPCRCNRRLRNAGAEACAPVRRALRCGLFQRSCRPSWYAASTTSRASSSICRGSSACSLSSGSGTSTVWPPLTDHVRLMCALLRGRCGKESLPTANRLAARNSSRALYTRWHGPALSSAWIWPARTPHDRGAAISAGLVLAAGLVAVTVRGSRDPVRRIGRRSATPVLLEVPQVHTDVVLVRHALSVPPTADGPDKSPARWPPTAFRRRSRWWKR